MNRKGHVGMTLLVFAPVAYLLVGDGKLLLAVLGWLGIQAVEPLPDQDFHLPFLNHRGLSHSLVAILVIGGVLGAGGWLLGDRVFEWLYALFAAGEGLWGWVLDQLPDLSASVLAGIIPNIPPGEIVATIQQQAGSSVSRRGFAMSGFFIGAYGVFAHLLGDVITKRGIKPFLPVSGWSLSLSSLRAESPIANSSLFFLGVLAIAVVLVATVPGAVLGAGIPADLSPVGVAGAQDSGANNGSVQINASQTDRTQVVLESVTLPQNGYIVAQDGNVSKNQSDTTVGHTRYVRNGTFENVALDLNETVDTSKLSVTLYNDSTGDETLNITGNGTTDTPYRTANGTPVRDSVQLGANGSENTTQSQNATSTNATVSFSNQTTNGSTVTVQSVTLSEPGFVTLHTSSYADDFVGPNESMIAVSQRLSAGTHQNVTIDVSNAPPGNAPGLNRSQVNETGTLAVAVYGDANANGRLDSVRSFGENDTIVTNNTSVIHDSASVRVPSPPRQTASLALENQTLQQQPQQRTLVVERARMPDGGFLVALNASYRQSGDPLTSIVGVSDYLSPGNHTNVTLDVRPGTLTRTQVVTVQPARDTNSNQQYDFVGSDGFQDVAYERRTGGQAEIITASAQVRVPGSDRTTQTRTPTTGVGPTSTTTAQGDVQGSGAPFGLSWLQFGLGALVVLVLPTFVRKFS
jgi:membrane-bound metal-dependent hydrolase YbcI (DUF457 family)